MIMNHDTTNQDQEVPNLKQNDNFVFEKMSQLSPRILEWINLHTSIICVWDCEGNLRFVSRSVKSHLGYDTSELLGTKYYQILTKRNISALRDRISESFSKKSFTLKVTARNGDEVWLECILEKIEDHDTNNIFIVGILNAIPKKDEPDEIFIRSEKMSVAGQIAAGVAHEIRNPLTSLKGFLQLVQAGTDQKDAYIKIMEEEIDKIESITSELLFLTKPITDHKRTESINSMVQDVLLLLQSQANLKDINIEFYATEQFYTYCDRSQVKQVLINIIKNAIEATDPSGTIVILIRSSGPYHEIDVIDEGPGISDEIIHKIGEPFFTTKQSGTGLGLMITKQILENHHGMLDIIQNDHIGSTFRISLPQADHKP